MFNNPRDEGFVFLLRVLLVEDTVLLMVETGTTEDIGTIITAVAIYRTMCSNNVENLENIICTVCPECFVTIFRFPSVGCIVTICAVSPVVKKILTILRF